MEKSEVLNKYTINKIDEYSVFSQNEYLSFSYIVSDSVVKEEYKGKYRYFGGLQCNYHKGSQEYRQLEQWLIEIAEKLLK